MVLTQGALSALIVARADSSLIEKALKSSSSRVALTAARGLLELEHPRALDLVRHLKKRLTGRARAEAGALLEHRRSRPALGRKTADDVPEDADDLWMRTRAPPDVCWQALKSDECLVVGISSDQLVGYHSMSGCYEAATSRLDRIWGEHPDPRSFTGFSVTSRDISCAGLICRSICCVH